MNKEIVNIGPGAKVETWRDGEWQILCAESAGSKTTLSLRDHDAWRLAYAMAPGIGQYFDRARAANAAVYELSYPDARADELRQVAREIDNRGCDDPCTERQLDRGDFCGCVVSENLRKLADALDLKATIEKERAKGWPRWRWFWYRALTPVSPRLAIRCLRPDEIQF